MDNNRIYLSVVISVYNDSKHLAEAIESVLNQSYPYFELIIVNDGSTDNSEEIVRRYLGDQRIRLISKENTGLADSLNKGIKSSRFDWIVRMDGDDICCPNRFDTLVKNIAEGLDIIGSNAEYFNEKGSLGVSNMPLSTEQIKENIRKGRSAFIHPSVMIRRSLLAKVGGYDKNFRRAQDQNLWIRCLGHAEGMINIEKPLLRYRFYAKSKKNNYEAILNGYIDNCLLIKKISRPLTTEEYFEIKSIIENTLAFKVSYRLSNFLYHPALKYLYPAWTRLGLAKRTIRTIMRNWSISY